jgi:hypothetical protein
MAVFVTVLFYEALGTSGRCVARALLLRLVVVPEDGVVVRRRVDAESLAAIDARAGVLDRLIAARLVTADESGVQLSHEALLTAWPRLRDWIDLDRAGRVQHRRFTEAVQARIREAARRPVPRGTARRGQRVAGVPRRADAVAGRRA